MEGNNKINDDELSVYFSGAKLIGDDFSLAEITDWYNDEKEGYSGVVSIDLKDDNYPYHAINSTHCFKYLPEKANFNRALGVGSAFGQEFEPIIHRIKELTILEPSDKLRTDYIGGLQPNYVKPAITGEIDFADNTFDLITSFGALHHIPNVSFVLGEIIRVLKPGGYYLLREPIVSMGDWRQPRYGLTKRERGIPRHIFDKVFATQKVEIVNKSYLTCMTSFIQTKLGFMVPKKFISYKSYVLFDKFLASVLQWNIRYHHVKFHHKLAPQSVAYVIKKLP